MIYHKIVCLRGRDIVSPKFPENKLMAYQMKHMKADTVDTRSKI
jgi:hypothetical protein